MENKIQQDLTKRQRSHIKWLELKKDKFLEIISKIEKKEFLNLYSFDLRNGSLYYEIPFYLKRPIENVELNTNKYINSFNAYYFLEKYLNEEIKTEYKPNLLRIKQNVITSLDGGRNINFSFRSYDLGNPDKISKLNLNPLKGDIIFHDFLESEISKIDFEKYSLPSLDEEQLIKKFKRTITGKPLDYTKNGEKIIRISFFDEERKSKDIYIKPDQSESYSTSLLTHSDFQNSNYRQYHERNSIKINSIIDLTIKFFDEVILRIHHNNYDQLKEKLEYAADQLKKNETIEFPPLKLDVPKKVRKSKIEQKTEISELINKFDLQRNIDINNRDKVDFVESLNKSNISPLTTDEEKLEYLLPLFSKNYFDELRDNNNIIDFNTIEKLFLIKKNGFKLLFEIINSPLNIDEFKVIIIEKKLSLFCINSFKALTQVLKNKINNFDKGNFESNKAKLLELKKEILDTSIDIDISFEDEIKKNNK